MRFVCSICLLPRAIADKAMEQPSSPRSFAGHVITAHRWDFFRCSLRTRRLAAFTRDLDSKKRMRIGIASRRDAMFSVNPEVRCHQHFEFVDGQRLLTCAESCYRVLVIQQESIGAGMSINPSRVLRTSALLSVLVIIVVLLFGGP